LLFVLAGCGGSTNAPTPPPPQLAVTCPPPVQASSLGGQPVAVTYGAAQATGGTGTVSVACSPAPETLFPTGTTTVTCMATDGGGRQASCNFSVTVTAIPRLLRTKIVAFGDSLTEGKLSAARLLVDAGPQSYPSQLKRLLDERYTGQTIDVFNEGYGGEVVSDDETFSRFTAALSMHQPGVILLMHGVNGLNEDTIDRYVNALEDLVHYARVAGLAVFLATLPPLREPGAGCPECVQPFNDDIRGIAALHGAVLVDVYAAFGNHAELIGADGLHPTAAGYDVMAHAFFDAIRQTLEAPPGSMTALR
jgi:lysophospholipase L1-like esterase